MPSARTFPRSCSRSVGQGRWGDRCPPGPGAGKGAETRLFLQMQWCREEAPSAASRSRAPPHLVLHSSPTTLRSPPLQTHPSAATLRLLGLGSFPQGRSAPEHKNGELNRGLLTPKLRAFLLLWLLTVRSPRGLLRARALSLERRGQVGTHRACDSRNFPHPQLGTHLSHPQAPLTAGPGAYWRHSASPPYPPPPRAPTEERGPSSCCSTRRELPAHTLRQRTAVFSLCTPVKRIVTLSPSSS